MHQNYAQQGTPAFPTTHRRYWAYLSEWDKAPLLRVRKQLLAPPKRGPIANAHWCGPRLPWTWEWMQWTRLFRPRTIGPSWVSNCRFSRNVHPSFSARIDQ